MNVRPLSIEKFRKLVKEAKGKRGAKATIITTVCIICIITTYLSSAPHPYIFIESIVFLFILIFLLRFSFKIDRWS